MSVLLEKQLKFCLLSAKLILWAHEHGYKVKYGEALRSKEQAIWNATKAGTGIVNSLHTKSLAVDLPLFIDGEYQIHSEAYKPLGDYWKSLDPDCCWGGDFSRPDGIHFSLTHEGVR